LSRDFLQRQRLGAEAAFFVSSTLVMLVHVLAGHPVMGLAFSRVAGQVVTVVVIMWLAPEKYWPGFDWQEAKALLAFGLPLAASNLLTIAIANVDFVVVGRLLHAQELGYYNLAFNISSWPVSIFSAVLISVTLPTLARVKDSALELARHLEAGMSAVVAASFPVCALFVALAGPLIDVVYGVRWHQAWKALVVLAFFGAARTILTLFSDLAIALGLTRWLFAIQFVWVAVLVPVMTFGVQRWGIMGAGLAHASVVILLVIPMYVLLVRSRTKVPLGWLRRSCSRPLLAAIGAGVVAYAWSHLVSNGVVQVVGGIVFGLLVYVLLAADWLRRVKRTLVSMYWHTNTQARDEVATATDSSMGDHSLKPEGSVG
jgi:PST family polysaccharide transporter